MAFVLLGVTFLIIFGAELAYEEVYLKSDDIDDVELEGHPVKINKTGALIPVVCMPNNPEIKLNITD